MRMARLTMIAALMAGMAGTVAHAGEPQRRVTVYLRDRTNVHPEVWIPAKALAGRIFAKIGISLTRVQISCLTTFPALKTLGIARL